MKKPPSIGAIVHYISYGTPGGEYPQGIHRAAIITEIMSLPNVELSEVVGLCVLNPTGMFFNRSVPYDETGQKPGTWHYPENNNGKRGRG